MLCPTGYLVTLCLGTWNCPLHTGIGAPLPCSPSPGRVHQALDQLPPQFTICQLPKRLLSPIICLASFALLPCTWKGAIPHGSQVLNYNPLTENQHKNSFFIYLQSPADTSPLRNGKQSRSIIDRPPKNINIPPTGLHTLQYYTFMPSHSHTWHISYAFPAFISKPTCVLPVSLLYSPCSKQTARATRTIHRFPGANTLRPKKAPAGVTWAADGESSPAWISSHDKCRNTDAPLLLKFSPM